MDTLENTLHWGEGLLEADFDEQCGSVSTSIKFWVASYRNNTKRTAIINYHPAANQTSKDAPTSKLSIYMHSLLRMIEGQL